MKHVLIVGATSAIAHAAARHLAAEGSRLFLVGRSESKLAAVADDLRVHGASEVHPYRLDLTDLDGHEPMLEAAAAALGEIDVLFVAYGTMPDHERAEREVAYALEALEVNATSLIALLLRAAPRFEAQRHGTIAVITSVAGDRGRRGNYVYGAAKAAASTFLAGLRSRMLQSNVRVVTIKPGPTETPLTAHLTMGPLAADVATTGRGVYQAIVGGKDVAYVPGRWLPIMTIIKLIPEAIFKRLNLQA